MAKAARAILINDNKILVMHRNKHGSEYYTLVGGRVDDAETLEQGLVREILEETGAHVTAGQLVFIEKHPAPYNEQYIFYCELNSYGDIKIQDTSEEGFMNRIGINTHMPMWVNVADFAKLPFRTPQLQVAIVAALQNGFPAAPLYL